MLKFYHKISPTAQRVWMRNHPVKYVALNATLLAAWFAYMAHCDRRFQRELEDIQNQNDN